MSRCYSVGLTTTNKIQLHIFADASEEAFAAVAYWRITSKNGVQIAFIAGKVKCAIMKTLSVPRLELQASVLATRLYNLIKDCHPDVIISQISNDFMDQLTNRSMMAVINQPPI